ncbi:RNA polymerase sigma factor [Citricoccus nitrophenolicus]|uniref:RNA polymerase sigma factor n=1 Tax=Citricoccus nitrophenolicus TaxID=863575 RepID=UPI0039B3DD31
MPEVQTTVDGEVLAGMVQQVRPVVWSVLGSMASVEVVDDVLQQTWESAWRVRARFDPAKGSLHAWVVTIARRRAIDHVRSLQRDRVIQDRAEDIATSRVMSSASLTQVDHAEATVEALHARQRVSKVLSVVEDVIVSREATARALALVLVFGDDLGVASRALGVAPDALRESRRELLRCCQVVVRAQALSESEAPVTMRALIECLPDEGETGQWIRQTAMACAHAGGRLEDVSVGHVMQATGFSHSTSRQYLAATRHLLHVAATVIARRQRPRSSQTTSAGRNGQVHRMPERRTRVRAEGA